MSGNCIPEPRCPEEDGAEYLGYTYVNHIYDNPGYLTCDYVPVDDPCLIGGECIPEPRCPDQDGAEGNPFTRFIAIFHSLTLNDLRKALNCNK